MFCNHLVSCFATLCWYMSFHFIQGIVCALYSLTEVHLPLDTTGTLPSTVPDILGLKSELPNGCWSRYELVLKHASTAVGVMDFFTFFVRFLFITVIIRICLFHFFLNLLLFICFIYLFTYLFISECGGWGVWVGAAYLGTFYGTYFYWIGTLLFFSFFFSPTKTTPYLTHLFRRLRCKTA